MYRKALRILFAAAMILALTFTEIAAALGPGGGAFSSASEITVVARKKKKKSSTPTPMPTVTPGPGEEESAGEIPFFTLDEETAVTPTPVPDGPITDLQSIVDWLFAHDMQLPDNFITKKEARALGWTGGNPERFAPGMMIGGDYFGNYEGKLPVIKGVEYHEADYGYTGSGRGSKRIIYSTDGRIWYTEDHYKTFTEVFPTVLSGSPDP